MADDNEFLTRDISTMSPIELDLALDKVTELGSPYHDARHKFNSIYQERSEALYQAKFKEPEGRQSETGDVRGLSDILRKEGLNSAEQIKQEAAEARGIATQAKVDQDIANCEGNLKTEWGSSYSENLETAKFFFKQLEISDMDKDWLKHSPPDGGPCLANDPEFIKAFVQVGRVLMQYNDKNKDEFTRFIKAWKPKKKK